MALRKVSTKRSGERATGGAMGQSTVTIGS